MKLIYVHVASVRRLDDGSVEVHADLLQDSVAIPTTIVSCVLQRCDPFRGCVLVEAPIPAESARVDGGRIVLRVAARDWKTLLGTTPHYTLALLAIVEPKPAPPPPEPPPPPDPLDRSERALVAQARSLIGALERLADTDPRDARTLLARLETLIHSTQEKPNVH